MIVLYKILGKNYNRVTVSSIECSKYNEIKEVKKTDGTHGHRIIRKTPLLQDSPEKVSKIPLKLRIAAVVPPVGVILGESPLPTSPEKVLKIPLKVRIAAVASLVGFGMMIGGAIIGALPLVSIGMIIGVIGMFYASLEYGLMMEEEEYYDPKYGDFGGKLDYCMSSEKEWLNNLMCKALDGVTELIEQGDASDIKEHVEKRILTEQNIGKIFKCLKRKDEKVKSSAASLIREALIQNQIGNGIKGNILIQLAVMARNENNNDSSNNAILKEYLGEEAPNLLKKLEFLCKESEISEYFKNPVEYIKNHEKLWLKGKDFYEIIDKIKNHTPVSQKTKYINTSIELAELGSN